MTGPRFIPTPPRVVASSSGVWGIVARMPSTNLRIAVSMLMALGTGVKVLAFNWDPSSVWLGFLTLWAGIDAAQFWAKRSTDLEYVEAAKPAPTTSTSTLTQPDGTVSETVTTPARPGEVA